MLKDRIRSSRITAHLTQQALADLVGVKRGAVAQWETGASKTLEAENLLAAAKAMDVSADWLATGKGDKRRNVLHNVTLGPDTRGFVPLISWVQAGSWDEAIDNLQPGEAEELLPCPAAHGLHTYALRVSGDSMTSQHGKSYPDGCIIFVDPDQRGGIENGARVIAKINGDNQVTFKQYIEDGGKQFLKPMNPQYPIITDEFRILGKVIGKWEDD